MKHHISKVARNRQIKRICGTILVGTPVTIKWNYGLRRRAVRSDKGTIPDGKVGVVLEDKGGRIKVLIDGEIHDIDQNFREKLVQKKYID